MIHPANLADLITRYQEKRPAHERTSLPRRPSPKRLDR